jgi:MoxR-like ATPase
MSLLLFGLGAGPRASQNLILAAKRCFNGKFSPDIEDVKAVATGIFVTEY